MKSAPVSNQANHKANNLDNDYNAKKIAEDNNLASAQDQFLTPDPLIFEAFFANSIGMLVKSDSLKSKEMNQEG